MRFRDLTSLLGCISKLLFQSTFRSWSAHPTDGTAKVNFLYL